MTPDELIELVKNGPTEQLVARLASLAKSERKKLSTTAVNLRKELIPKDRGPILHDNKRPGPFRAKLVLLAVGPLTEAQRIRLWHLVSHWDEKHNHANVVFQILRDRKPAWISQWVDKELEERDVLPDWRFIRRLIKEGVCPKPQSESYILRLLLGSFVYCDRNKSLKENLLDDPDLLDDEIWRIFDMAPVRGAILVGTDITAVADGTGRGPNEAGSWGYVLRDFSREGKLDRQRLLAASLTAILRNSKGSNTVWFCRFHELLEPTPEERLSLEGPYLQLLSHPVPAVADFAIDALRILAKDNRLDFDKLIDAITPVFRLEPKAQPLAALKLLAGSKTSDGRFSHKLATAVIPGLGHPAPQVQEAILQFLHKLGNGEDEVISNLLQQHFEMLAPSVREKARQMIVALPAKSPPTVTPSEGSSSAELLEEARKLPSSWPKGAGIDALLHAIETNGDLPALTFDPMSIPRLHDDQRVQPIQTLEELIERLTIAIEDLNDPIEFELLLDGLSRLCDQQPDDFLARLAPLLKRIEKLIREAVQGENAGPLVPW